MFVIARKGGALTKQSLFASTIGSAARLVSRHRRLLRTLCALAMTDLGSPKEKVDPTVFGDYPIIGQSCAMTSYSRHCEEGRSPDEAISLYEYNWKCRTIGLQAPEIASDATRPRNDRRGSRDCFRPFLWPSQ